MFRNKARAIATRWRCPPDKLDPRGPTSESNPFGSFERNSETWAISTAFCNSSSSISSLPNVKFSRNVSSKSRLSWDTTEICDRRTIGSTSEFETPEIVISPLVWANNRVSVLKIVVLPAPEAPTKAVVLPAAATNETLSKTVVFPKLKLTFLKAISPLEENSCGIFGPSRLGFWSKISRMR